MTQNNINLEFIERYQKLFEKDPKSKVFAPLGEAYRKMGLLNEALQVLQQGVKCHPHFPSGQVALAKVLFEQNKFDSAIDHLLIATELSPENILAQKLLAQCYLQVRKTKKALKSFKMVLFLNPNDAQAQSHVKRLESLTADEYEDDVFEMRPLKTEMAPSRYKEGAVPAPTKSESPSASASYREKTLDRTISLADAFIARLDLERAMEILDSLEKQIGEHPEITKRKNFLSSRLNEGTQAPPLDSSKNSQKNLHQRIDILQNLLQKIESRRFTS